MEGDELHPSATMRLNVVLEEELRSCLLMVPKLGETVADRIIKERICRGQVSMLAPGFIIFLRSPVL